MAFLLTPLVTTCPDFSRNSALAGNEAAAAAAASSASASDAPRYPKETSNIENLQHFSDTNSGHDTPAAHTSLANDGGLWVTHTLSSAATVTNVPQTTTSIEASDTSEVPDESAPNRTPPGEGDTIDDILDTFKPISNKGDLSPDVAAEIVSNLIQSEISQSSVEGLLKNSRLPQSVVRRPTTVSISPVVTTTLISLATKSQENGFTGDGAQAFSKLDQLYTSAVASRVDESANNYPSNSRAHTTVSATDKVSTAKETDSLVTNSYRPGILTPLQSDIAASSARRCQTPIILLLSCFLLVALGR
jgi:hypothetical protein